MKLSNIPSIIKKRGSSHLDMDYERGLFCLTIFKKVAEYLIFEEIYEDLDANMGISNIGGRKNHQSKDHLFVLYGIISDVVSQKNEFLDIKIYDIEKAFDKIWLQDSFLDLIETLPDQKINDKISFLFETNKETLVSIKTPFGCTERITFENIFQQGGIFGHQLCSNSTGSAEKRG